MRSALPTQAKDDGIVRNWQLSLGLGLVVTGAAAGLLLAVTREARGITRGAGEVWQVGTMIAGNTVHIPHIHHVNQTVDRIGERLDAVARSTERIRRAATGGSQKEG